MTGMGDPQAGYVPVNGTRLYYEEMGDGHPVVLIHAGIADCRMWDDQWQALAAHYRVVRYDVRGFGRSDLPSSPFSSTDDLHSLLAYLGVDQAYLIGASMGGGIALDFTLEHADTVDALILVGSSISGYSFSSDAMAQWAAMEAASTAGDIAQVVELELRMWVDGRGRTPDEVDPRVRERIRMMETANVTRGAEEIESRPLDHPAIDRLDEIAVPTLVVVGERDISDMLAIADRLEAGIASARKAVLPNTAHVPSMEQPETFNRLVLDFLRGL